MTQNPLFSPAIVEMLAWAKTSSSFANAMHQHILAMTTHGRGMSTWERTNRYNTFVTEMVSASQHQVTDAASARPYTQALVDYYNAAKAGTVSSDPLMQELGTLRGRSSP